MTRLFLGWRIVHSLGLIKTDEAATSPNVSLTSVATSLATLPSGAGARRAAHNSTARTSATTTTATTIAAHGERARIELRAAAGDSLVQLVSPVAIPFSAAPLLTIVFVGCTPLAAHAPTHPRLNPVTTRVVIASPRWFAPPQTCADTTTTQGRSASR